MTDRELLELAAKAAGIVVVRSRLHDPLNRDMLVKKSHHNKGQEHGGWNPLADDGDALRLAVRLGMNVFQAAKSAYALPSDDDGTYEEQVRYVDVANDQFAATRRAIVRAAAEIGKAMP
jgi:hypothetical protein